MRDKKYPRATANLGMLELIARKLGDLNDQVVYVGGCTTALFINDPLSLDVRPTVDVDCIIEISSLEKYYHFADKLRKKGFKESMGDAVMCRWRYDDLILDVMPTDETILKFGNCWYKEALAYATVHAIASDLSIKAITAPYFIATKIEAFKARGNNDFLGSHDLEDIITVIAGCSDIIADISSATAHLKRYLKQSFEAMLKNNHLELALPGHLNDGPVTDPRVQMVMERIREIIIMNMNRSNNKMHADEVEITKSLVQQLVAEQFPHWARLSIEPVESAGTSNAIYRLGKDMSVRLPRIPSAVSSIKTEFVWLSKISSYLPFAVPIPIAMGKPTEDYPWCWTVCQWVEGRNPIEGQLVESNTVAIDLARFITVLHKITFSDGPESERGKLLSCQNEEACLAIEALHGKIDTKAVRSRWEEALQVPQWNGPPTWIHGDLMPGNLLIKDNRLSAVIDFSYLGMGDPATDLITAWNLLPARSRDIFRKKIQVDDATWARGKGWALSMALIQLPYYEHTNPVMAANARYTINEVLSSD